MSSPFQASGTPTSFSGNIQDPCQIILEDFRICKAANRDKAMCREEFEDFYECLKRENEVS